MMARGPDPGDDPAVHPDAPDAPSSPDPRINNDPAVIAQMRAELKAVRDFVFREYVAHPERPEPSWEEARAVPPGRPDGHGGHPVDSA